VDYFPKPEFSTWKTLEDIKEEIVKKVRNAATSNIKKRTIVKESRSIIPTALDHTQASNKVVLIGASTGGVQALTKIVERLPQNTPGIALVQHMPATFIDPLAEQLSKKTSMSVKVAENNEPLLPGKIVIAPGNFHLEITKRSNLFYTRLSEGKPVGYHIPAVNVLFLSAARIGCPEILGIILTGMGEDGAQGILQMKMNQCRTIGQDQESSVVYGMPKKAFELGGVEQQVSLSAISQKIVEFAEERLK